MPRYSEESSGWGGVVTARITVATTRGTLLSYDRSKLAVEVVTTVEMQEIPS